MLSSDLRPGAVDALLFDLGRVVIDIDFVQVVSRWASHAGRAPEDIAARFVRDEIYHGHERGTVSDAAFFANLRQQLGIDITDDQFLEGWNAIFVGPMPGIGPLLARAADRLPLYALSNTNQPHIEHFSSRYADLLGHFRKIFLSSSIGLRKPDAEAYQHVVQAIGIRAERILFFDDLTENIEGARDSGLQAVLVRSTEDIAAALQALGI